MNTSASTQKKTVLMTGASSGIGRAAVRLFAGNGWNVVAAMRAPGHEKEFTGRDDILVTRLDVRESTSIELTLHEALVTFGRIDALVNNAGYGQYGLFEAVSPSEAREQFEVNVFGVMEVTRALLPHFRKNHGGTIVNVSSGAGIFTLPMISLYCASKFALEGFSEALSYELASQNIAVKIVQPHGGVTGTAFNDRATHETANDPALADYDEFTRRTREAFAAMTAARTVSADDVARVIYEAATDGATRLRYLVGNDTRGFIAARRGMADQDYVDFMRAHFSPAS